MTDTIPAAARILLDLIYQAETGRAPPACYTTIIGHREGQLQKPITAMTLDELLAAQRGWGKKWKSSAAGAPQIIRATLQNLVTRLALSGKEKFTPELQDRMAFTLLLWRGWETFAAGRMSITVFGNALAKEWASFPVLTPQKGPHGKLKRGQSYYDGDGLNSALISPDKVEATLRLVLQAAGKPADASAVPEAPKPVPTPQPQPAPAPAGKTAGQTPKQAAKKLSVSKRLWTWLSAGGGTAILPYVDWRLQLMIGGAIIALAVYGIATMPEWRVALRGLFGKSEA
jgi:muramidase (phage lysozyme)